MNWSWKSFGLQLVSAFVLGLGSAYLISLEIDARRGTGAPDSTVLSMAIAGLLAPTILAALSGWKGWSLRPLLAAGFIVSTIYSGNPAIGIISLFTVAIVFSVALKARAVAFYYSPRETSTPEGSGPESKNSPKRPKSVFWAGILFWVMSLGILSMHTYFATQGIVEIHAFVTAALLLSAALLWLIRPAQRVTFYFGASSLIVAVIWGALTARTQYLLRAQFPNILSDVAFTLCFTAVVTWLTYRYIFGHPSRSYFQRQ